MPQSDPSPPEASSIARDFVFWPEENGAKRTEPDLGAVARKLSAGESPPSRAKTDDLGDGREEATVYPATSTWRRTTSRAATLDQERWWEDGPSLAGATVGAPAPIKPKSPQTEPVLSPDEIWELTARELAEAPVLRTKGQAPPLERSAPPAGTVAAEFEPVVRQLSASLRPSPFAIATGATMPRAAPDAPIQPLESTPVADALQEEIVFPRAIEPTLTLQDTEWPEFESAPARPVFTFWRLVLLLILGLAVAAVLCREQLSEVDWRGLWRNTMQSLGSITKPAPTPPVKKAVPFPVPGKSSAGEGGAGTQLIEAPAAPAAVDPRPETSRAGDDARSGGAPGGAGPVVAPPPPPEAGDGGPKSAATTLWSGDDPAALAQGEPRPPTGGQKHPLSAADQPEAAEAQAAVQHLITADSTDKVLPWIFEPDKLGTMVRDYHAIHPLSALTGAVVELEYSGVIPSSGAKAFIFNVLHPDHPRGFPVSAEHTPEGYRIDWQSYIQWRDEWLRRFVEKKSTEPQMLFVVLRRTHYFNDDVPRLDEKLCFKISSAVPGDEGTVAFVDHPSALSRLLQETYEWRRLYFPVVEVQWVRGPNSTAYVRLNRIVRPTWRRVGD